MITDESRGWSREWERALCPTSLKFRLFVRQSRQLIIAERGATPKARLSFLAQSADGFALGHRADETCVRAHLAPKKRYQRFSLRAARPAPTKHTSMTLDCKVY